ncbi:4-hydroxybenzoate octaprenyltransferase [Wenzhouxiangella sp. XN24]|uniref:4-hydroxybenzoate octaprenyltransferase n=1 Tax=Wenzhouxiangella sp. XN24 TaxID=2713569 RepID=UPI0013EAECBB|nr:4-hydroxybenzoate octaprenyltransferase [Wenzhouxiangella sp. XN24]NGX17460.1 4-hydroxybenzoate octaprenyltransferase [Wenzhouxiangella sp. XN24]
MPEPVEARGPAARLAAQLREYALLMRLHRPIGTLLLLWPTLWALWVAAEGRPDPHVFLVFVAGVVLMRSAGCVMNDFADRRIDPHVERTRDRPLPRGTVTPIESLLIAAALGAAAFALVLTLNRLTVLLALGGAVLTITYPFLKRFTHLPQVWLGAAFGWSVPMAFAAQTGAVPPLAWLMFIAVMLWAVVYDTMYAMVDRDDDLKLGVRSTAILFGDADRQIIGAVQVLLLIALWLVGRQAGLGGWYYGALLLAGLLSAWQQVLIRRRRPADCFRAFLNNNYYGMVVFLGILLHYTFTSG